MHRPSISRVEFEWDGANPEDFTQSGEATLTASGTAHTKGSYAQIVASTPFDVGGFYLYAAANAASSTDTGQLLDLAIGGSGSEQIILGDLAVGSSILKGGHENNHPRFIPLFIPEGQEIRGRIQAVQASDTLEIDIHFVEAGAFRSYQQCKVYGVDAAATEGALLQNGSWNEIEASTDYDIEALMQWPTLDTSLGGDRMMVRVGTGAASSEVQIWPPKDSAGTLIDFHGGWRTGSGENLHNGFPSQCLPITIPASTRLASYGVGARLNGIQLLGFSGAING